MPLDDSTISGLTVSRHGADLVVSWAGSLPAGRVYQVYLDGDLAWFGSETEVDLPIPSRSSGMVHVYTVPASSAATDFSVAISGLAGTGSRVQLTWLGGSSETASLVGYRVYGGDTPGASPDRSLPLATIQAVPGGLDSQYVWTSDPYRAGTWNFAVVPYDDAGNEGTPYAWSVVVSAPPGPPAAFLDGTRIHGTYNASSHTVTLTWNAPAY